MEVVVPLSRVAQLKRVAAGSSVPPAVIAGATSLSGVAGLYAVSGAIDTTLSAHAGVPPWTLLVPGFAGGPGTWTLTVYGLYRAGQGVAPTTGYTTAPPALYLPVPLIQTTVNANYDPSGATDANTLAAADNLAGTLGVVPGADVNSYMIYSYGSGVGAAHLLIRSAGADYLLFESSESSGSAFVLAGNASL